mmetsp:Transcript_23972/g.77892  ORF Transcript_23972/g.77892 Transcript_23972/m.77892 type:complete len:352 (+) Transcript_23972:61-1116(+)
MRRVSVAYRGATHSQTLSLALFALCVTVMAMLHFHTFPHWHAKNAPEPELYRLRRAMQNRARTTEVAPMPSLEEQSLASPRIMSHEEVRELLSAIAPSGRRTGNCSVVGNDSSMRYARFGSQIDSAQAVYRMNFAPIKAFEENVGKGTHTQCLNPEKMRLHLKENPAFRDDVGQSPRILVVGDIPGEDKSGNAGPCVERSAGGMCIARTNNERVRGMPSPAQRLAEELLYTLQLGVGEEDSVPTTGLYCLVLALTECERVDVFGIGAGTIAHENLQDLEYFKDPHFRGWDARHNAEAERTLLRVLASNVWKTPLAEVFGALRWHNPLGSQVLVNERLIANSPCTSGIHCRR